MIEPISRDKSTFYGGGGSKGQKYTDIVLFVPTLLATNVGLRFRGGKIVLEESRGAESKGVSHNLRCHNKMDNACARKD